MVLDRSPVWTIQSDPSSLAGAPYQLCLGGVIASILIGARVTLVGSTPVARAVPEVEALAVPEVEALAVPEVGALAVPVVGVLAVPVVPLLPAMLVLAATPIVT